MVLAIHSHLKTRFPTTTVIFIGNPDKISGRCKNFQKGAGAEDHTMYQHHRHLLQMHTTNYMPFIWEIGSLLKKNLGQYGVAAPPPIFNLPLDKILILGQWRGQTYHSHAPKYVFKNRKSLSLVVQSRNIGQLTGWSKNVSPSRIINLL